MLGNVASAYGGGIIGSATLKHSVVADKDRDGIENVDSMKLVHLTVTRNTGIGIVDEGIGACFFCREEGLASLTVIHSSVTFNTEEGSSRTPSR
jgi:hypothetical protein